MKKIRYFSTFSGIGGFELGINQAYERLCDVDGSEDGGSENDTTYDERQGLFSEARKNARTSKRSVSECIADLAHQRPLCVGFSEIDKYATQIYQKHFPEHKNYGDITKIDAETLPDFDLLVGGFPCQAFSIAGKRKGFEDTRGTLFFDLARILKAKRPRYFVFENVKGLLSHDDGSTFKTIIAAIDELGYDCQWQVLNSKNHGVPQNRERVIIVGHLRGTPRPEVFPIGCGDEEHLGKVDIEGCASTLTGRSAGWQNRRGNYIIKAPCIRIPEATKKGYAVAKVGDSINLSVPNSKTRRGRVGGGLAQTLDTGVQQYTLTRESRIRRLTPVECERLQGFPDGWTEGISDTQRYKCCGNAVTTNVIRDVMERLLK